jgi:hypothetical protein
MNTEGRAVPTKDLIPELSSEENSELQRLCGEYKTATLAVSKTLHVGNPPDPGKVQLFLDAEAKAAAVVARIREILECRG